VVVRLRAAGSWLREEGADRAFDQASADRALPQRRGALLAHHQVSTGDEDDVHFFIHAHLAGTLLLQAPQLLLHGEVCEGRDSLG